LKKKNKNTVGQDVDSTCNPVGKIAKKQSEVVFVNSVLKRHSYRLLPRRKSFDSNYCNIAKIDLHLKFGYHFEKNLEKSRNIAAYYYIYLIGK